MKREPYTKVGQQNDELLAHIRRIKANHPFGAIKESGRIYGM